MAATGHEPADGAAAAPALADDTDAATAVATGDDAGEKAGAGTSHPGVVGGRRRARQVVARSRQVGARFSAEEMVVLEEAAKVAGLTVTGFVASRAVAVARGEVAPLASGTGDVVRELVEARTVLRRYGTLLNQSVAKLNATGVADAGLVAAVDRCERAMVAIGEAVARLGRAR